MRTALTHLIGVRPITCILLTTAFVGAVLSAVFVPLEIATFMAATLGTPQGMAIMWYFKRAEEKEREA